MGVFDITELPLAAGLVGLCPMRGRGGDLRADIALLAGWNTELVVSLVESTELATLGGAGLPDMLAGAGIDWQHFPIRDFDIPSKTAQVGWARLSTRISGLLRQGGRVVLHCRGGCGRTGMMALRLMVEQGEDPGAALLRLRALRPCAVETDAQQVWAEGATATGANSSGGRSAGAVSTGGGRQR